MLLPKWICSAFIKTLSFPGNWTPDFDTLGSQMMPGPLNRDLLNEHNE